MNVSLWKSNFTKTYAPAWPCPTCKKGTFRLVKDSLVFRETISSKKYRRDPDSSYDDIDFVFNAWVKCDHVGCGEEASVAGTGGIEPYYDQHGDTEYDEYFAPKYCTPMPDIFEIPEKCPPTVSTQLRKAFSLFWSDPAAATNHIRIALERLLDAQGVQKKEKVKGKFRDLWLDARIKKYSEREPILGTQLMALKHLGNTGSHEGDVLRREVLSAFEILELTLEEIVKRRTPRIMDLAKELTRNHRPGAKKRRMPF